MPVVLTGLIENSLKLEKIKVRDR